jgi:hypothetical protein
VSILRSTPDHITVKHNRYPHIGGVELTSVYLTYHLTCPRNAKKTEKVIQSRPIQRKPGGHGITTLPWHHHHHPQIKPLMIPPELTYLECKNPDGSAYFQILDSDDENETAASDDEDEAERSEERIK